jgi:hypothetical protein
LALDHAEKVHSFDLRLRLEVDLVRQKLEIRIQGLERLREIDAEVAEETKRAHQRALDAVSPSWYEHPAFVVPVTALAVAGFIFGCFALAAEYGKFLWAQ